MKKLLLSLLLLAATVLQAQTTQEQIKALVPHGNEVYRFAYQQLSDDDKAVYDALLDAFITFEANNFAAYQFHKVPFPAGIEEMDIYYLKDMLNKMSFDIPELYILNSTVPRYDNTTGVSYGRVGYKNTPASYLSELQQLETIYNTFAADFTPEMDDYEKLKILHDAFINWGDYGDMTGADAGNVRGALINKKAVCQGFAYAGLYLCQRAGIPCLYISGQLCTSTTNDTWTNHSWNYVYLDGEWYLMDLTTDGGFPNVLGYSAFLKGQAYQATNYRLYSTEGTYPNTEVYGENFPTIAEEDYDRARVGLPTAPTIESNAKSTAKRGKILRNGQIVIEVDGQYYTPTGALVK